MHRFTSIIRFCLAVFLLLPAQASAAQAFFSSKDRALPVGETFEVRVLLNTQTQRMNAVEGSVLYPSQFLKLESVREGGSLVTLWVESPKEVQEGVIHFSGIVPGGYDGTDGLLFRLVFRVAETGEGDVRFDEIQAFADDGFGTPVAVRIEPFHVTGKTGAASPSTTIGKDRTPPEPFSVTVAKDPLLFDGRWFATFSAKDRGFGLDRYEVQEYRQPIMRFFVPWEVIEPPYPLTDQSRQSWVRIRAIDAAGNIRTAVLSPAVALKWYHDARFYSILIVALCVAGLMYILLRKGRLR